MHSPLRAFRPATQAGLSFALHKGRARRCVWPCAVTLLITLNAYPADNDPAMAECRSIEDRIERLACYDALTEEAEGSIAPPDTHADPDRAMPVQEDVPHEASDGSPDPLKRPQRKRSKEAKKQAREERQDDEKIVSRVRAVRKLHRGNYRLTLENGQIWQESQYNPRTGYEIGDEVEITPSFISGYKIYSTSTKRTVKAQRIE